MEHVNFDEFVNKMLDRKMSTQEWVLHFLREAILQGYFQDGETIDTTKLAEKLGVSRMPIRLALAQLEKEGLVIIKPHKKAVASKLSAEEIRKVYQIRFELETLATRLAISKIREEHIEQLTEYIKLMDEKKEISDFIKLNNQFHSLIYGLSNNEFLVKIIEQLRNNVERYLRLYVSNRENHDMANHEHKMLLKALIEHNEEEADKILRKHLNRTCETVARNLEDYSRSRK